MATTVGMVIKEKKMTKKEVCEKLVEAGIEFDGKAKLDDLIALLPAKSEDEDGE